MSRLTSSGTSARSRAAAQGDQGYKLGDRAGRSRGFVRQGAPRARRGHQKRVDSSDARGPKETKQLPVPGYGFAPRSTSSSSAQRSRPSSTESTARRPTRSGTRRPAPSSRSTRRTAPSARSPPTRPSTRPSTRATQEATSRRCSTRPSPRAGLSRAQPRDRRRLPARLDVQAGDGARRDAGAHPAPYNSLMHRLVHGRRPEVQQLGPGVNAMMTLPTALAQSCDTYFYQVGKAFYDLPPDRGQPLQRWAKTFGFGQPTGIDVGPETSGLRRRSSGSRRPSRRRPIPDAGRSTASGSRVTRSSSRSARRTCSPRRSRWRASTRCSRTAASSSSRTSSRRSSRAAARRPAPRRAHRPPPLPAAREGAEPRPRRDRRHPPRASTRRRTRRTARRPASSATTRKRSPARRGRPRRASTPATYMRKEDTAWWCGFGPYEKPELVVCAVIENGGYGGEIARRRRSRCSRSTSGSRQQASR